MWIVSAIAFLGALAIAFGTRSEGRQPLRDASLTVLMLIGIGAAAMAILVGGALRTMAPPPAPKPSEIAVAAPAAP